jgi:serpin B
MNRPTVGLVLCACLPLASFAGSDAPDLNSVVTGNTAFALDLYAKLRSQDGNLFFSPYSISTALAMTYGGARGETARQMARTLHFDLAPDKLHPPLAALQANLNAIQQKGQVKLAVANSLWPQKGYAFLPDYLALCQKYYGTSITPVDYRGDTGAARKTINDWVEQKTNHKIVELLKPGVLNGLTRLVLANAIYFKGTWDSPFRTRLTTYQPFHVTTAKTVSAPLMEKEDRFRYADLPDLQVLELPYAGDDLSMLVLLPRKVDGLGDLEANLTTQNLTAWTTGLERQEVDVFLPKFKTTAEFSLAETLAILGMADAFSSRADFSGMDGRKDLFISAVVHKAFVEVNEEGTEAAAATGVMARASAVRAIPQQVPVFRADHPFLFLIRDNHTGSVLFLGRITDPTK